MGLSRFDVDKMKANKDVDGLINILKEGEISVHEAAYALGEIGGDVAINALAEMLENKDWGVRATVVQALGRTRAVNATDSLTKALNDEDSWVRANAIYSLGDIGGEKAVDVLIECLKNETNPYRAMLALRKIGAPAIEALIKAQKSKNIKVRERATETLGDIGEPIAFEALVQTLRDDDDHMRERAAEALGKIGDIRATKPLLNALRDERKAVRESATRALERIRALNFSWVAMNKLAGFRGPTGDDDLEFLKKKHIYVLVRLAEKHKALVTTEQVSKFGFEDHPFPIPDFNPPSETQIEQITKLVKDRLDAGNRVAVSCGAGIGRTGTILMCILISMCHSYEEASVMMKDAGRKPFETDEQKQAITNYAKKIGKLPHN